MKVIHKIKQLFTLKRSWKSGIFPLKRSWIYAETLLRSIYTYIFIYKTYIRTQQFVDNFFYKLKQKSKLNRIKYVGFFLVTASLTSCATTNNQPQNQIDYEHAVPLLSVGSPEEDVPSIKDPLLEVALSSGEKNSLADLGLNKANTVFVPAQYTKSKKGQLFINDTLFVSPNGYDNVLGYIKDGSAGLVAVVEPQPLQPLQRKSVLAYYKVSLLTGKTINKVGIVPIDYPIGITTTEAIFGIAKTGSGLSYNGYNKKSEAVSGPQNVRDATPIANEGWLLLKDYNPSFPMISSSGWNGIGNKAGSRIVASQSSVYFQSKNNTTKLLGTSAIKHFVHTQRIIVDQSTLTDSEKSGLAWTISEFRSCKECGNVFRSAPFGLLISGKEASIAPGKGMYITVNATSQIEINNNLVSLHGKSMNIWQDRRLGNWILASNSSQINSPLYRVMGWKQGVALDGKPGFLWGGETRIAQIIDTPNHLIIYRNRGNSDYYKGYEDQGMGFDLITKKYIDKNEMLGWLSQYGAVIGRSNSPVYY